MKRFMLVALLALGGLVGGGIATSSLSPAPAATLPAPTATPSAAPSAGQAASPDLGLPAGYPSTYYFAFNLNTVNTAIDIVNLTGTPGQQCQVSVWGTFSGVLGVTQANTVAHLQSSSYITGWIIGPGNYTFNVNSAQTMFQVENLIAVSGSPLVSANCQGGTLLLPGALLK